MPSLPALPAKNSSLTDTAALEALYNKATREYLNRNLSAALSTLAILRTQALTQKFKRRYFALYIAVLDSSSSLSDVDLKAAFGRESVNIVGKLRNGLVWEEAETYLGSSPPTAIAVSMILSLVRHMDDDVKLQQLVEAYLTSLDIESAAHDSISELYALHVLPRGKEWGAAREYIENCDISDEKRESWLQALKQVQIAQEEAKIRLAKEVAERQRAEEAKKVKKVRKTKTSGSKRSAASANSSQAGSTIFPGKSEGDRLPGSGLNPSNIQDLKVDKGESSNNAVSDLSFLSRWTKTLTLHFSPRIIQMLLFLALLFGATGRREIREKIKVGLRKAGSTIAAGFKVSYV